MREVAIWPPEVIGTKDRGLRISGGVCVDNGIQDWLCWEANIDRLYSSPMDIGEIRMDTEQSASVTLPGVVEQVIESTHPAVPERAQIAVEGADDLYREIRINNTLKTSDGETVTLKEGDEVKVTVEAPVDAPSEK